MSKRLDRVLRIEKMNAMRCTGLKPKYVALTWIVALTGCVQPAPTQVSVRHVDWSQAPEMAAHAERLRQIGDEVYPKIRLLLKDGARRTPRVFDIIFTNEPGGNTGQALGSHVCLNAHYVSTPAAPDRVFKSPADLEAVLVHEMTHIVQQYDSSAPVHWGEGMADYVCAKLGYTNAFNCLRCSAEYPHYLSGYHCAGAFLLFVETRYAADLIPQLHRSLRRRSYTDSLFSRLTGKDLDQLWSEFHQTAAFTSAAAETLRLQQAFGIVNGKSPPDIVRRAEAYFKLPAGTVTNAVASLIALKHAGLLPGFSRDERASASVTSSSFAPANPGPYPLALTLYVRKPTNSSLYSFTVTQSSEGQPWQLQAARRLSRDYRVVEELSLTH